MLMSAGIALDIDEMLPKNHRMVEAARDLWRVQLSLLKQGYLEMVAQDHNQTALEYLQGGKLPSSLGSLC